MRRAAASFSSAAEGDDVFTREGTFALTLPSGHGSFASRCRSPGWQEAEVVPAAVARAAYEEALQRRIDPAVRVGWRTC